MKTLLHNVKVNYYLQNISLFNLLLCNYLIIIYNTKLCPSFLNDYCYYLLSYYYYIFKICVLGFIVDPKVSIILNAFVTLISVIINLLIVFYSCVFVNPM